jgi:hypothetical protein
MATMTEVKQQRKAFDGRDTYERFAAYCQKSQTTLTEDILAAWDEKHNDSQIRNHYGSRKDIYQLGLKELYQRFLTSHCLKIPNGAPVRLPSGATYQPRVNERRVIGTGVDRSVVPLREVTNQQMGVIRDQFRTALRQLLRTQKFFNMSAADIREIVTEVLDETVADKE